MDKVILKADELDGYLTAGDKDNLKTIELLYKKVIDVFPQFQNGEKNSRENLIKLYNEMGSSMQDICDKLPRIHVYSFVSPEGDNSEASRVIAKLRDVNTNNRQFLYYIKRAYEMLYKFAWGGVHGAPMNNMIVKTPVTSPVQNYAVHKIANIDNKICNTVMCVMLRGALLPSMIMSKEIEEYSSGGYVTPFALFKIHRNDSKQEKNMEYLLDLKKSFFDPQTLDGKDLVFADPMNATGGSFIAVVKYLASIGVKPRSILFFNAISALKGAMRVVRAIDNCDVYTLWMDGVLNKDAYIMPGLGDAGDRLNGSDNETNPRNIIQLLADYGADIADLYRCQLGEIENTVLNNRI